MEHDTLAAAWSELEAAAWARHFSRLERARARILALTGVTVVPPLRRMLEAERVATEAKWAAENRT